MGNTCAKLEQPPPKAPTQRQQPPRIGIRQPPLFAHPPEHTHLPAVIDPIPMKSSSIYQDYIFIYPRIGKGTFGDVYKVVHKKNGLIRAVKQILGDRNDTIRDLSEFDILKRLVLACPTQDHPNIVRIYETYLDERDIFIVMELCTGGELFEYIVQQKRLSQSIAASYMQQILSAVAHCHANSIVHRDLKPSNIMLNRKDSNPVLKVIDFGASTLMRSNNKVSKCIGTTYYIAPEALQGNGQSPCDIWSCGAILHVMLTGDPPFTGRNDQQIIRKASLDELEFRHRVWAVISKQARDLVLRMLQKDPTKRITAQEALKHPWITTRQHNSALDQKELAETINNLGNFRQISNFQESIMNFVATYLITENDKKQIIRQFHVLDTNSDGRISKQELVEAYKRIDKLKNITVGEVEQIFTELDRDMSGYIDYRGTSATNIEFVTASIHKSMLVKRTHLEQTFDLIDKDRNGYLSLKELEVFLGGAITKSVYDGIIRQCGGDPDQQITREMFMGVMLKVADGHDT